MMDFKLIIRDYNTFQSLSNKCIQIANIDSKQTLNNITNKKGEVIFSIKECERGDFFNVNLINDNDYEQNPYYLAKQTLTNSQGQQTTQQTTQKILTPNNYQNHPAVLYFNQKQNGNVMIGVLKAYKTNNNFITMDNSFESFIDEWQDEIFTIDDKQTLRIQAFLYDFDRNGDGENKKESIDKNKTTYYQRNLLDDTKIGLQGGLDNINWYYQVLYEDNPASLKVNQNAKNLTFISGQNGTNIYFNLSMLKANQRAQAKRIRIFAYVGEESEVMYANSINLDTNLTNVRNNRIERIYCVELKIVRTRFSLLFDGENLILYENERLLNNGNESCLWSARSGKAIDNIQIKNDKTFLATQDRLCVKLNETHSFYYDTRFQEKEIANHQAIKESKEYFFVKLQNSSKTSLNIYSDEKCTEVLGQINSKSFSTENKNINLNEKFSHFIETLQETLKRANINLGEQDFVLPLRVEYKKRIIINIRRISQTTQSTKAEFSMSMDNQVWTFKDSTNIAYILERPSPDCITPNLELRIPEGRYNVAWHTSSDKYKNCTLKLYNNYIPQERAILIHAGRYPQNSQNCLLLEEKIGEKNQLKRGDSIVEKLRNEFKTQAFKEKFGSMPNAASHIMVIIRNEFGEVRRGKVGKKATITPEMLKEVFNGVKDNQIDKIRILQEIANELNRESGGKPMYVHYKLDTRNRLEHFFAQCWVEAGAWLNLEEGFGYKTAESLKETFSSKFQGDNAKKADELVALRDNKEKAIANYVYSDRNGNKGGDDGWNFRGRGIIQLTGRYNYKDFADKAKKWGWADKDFTKEPDLLAKDGKYTIMSAAYFWISKKCYTKAIGVSNKDVDNITALINRYTDSYPKRRDSYKRIREANIFKDFKED